jgi:sugar lactone lactonase YvrE
VTRIAHAGLFVFLLLVPARLLTAQPGVITRVAGTGVAGFSGDNGPATAARLNTPRGAALDADGNLYIADSGNNRIRRVDAATGTITTVAGTGVAGFSGDAGPASAARLWSPRDVVIDGSGNLFIADSRNNRVRRIDAATGIISTVAGTGVFGAGADGILATASDLREPVGLAVDAAGHLYLAERSGHRVRRVDAATGFITTVAGTGVAGFNGNGILATAAQLNAPAAIIADEGGHLFIADTGNNRVRRISAATGLISTVAGTGVPGFAGDDGAATAARLSTPTGIRLDESGHLFIADSGNDRVRRVDSETGLISTIAGNGTAGGGGDGGLATAAQLNRPYSLRIDEGGNLYIVEEEGDRVRRVEGAAAAPNGDPEAAAAFTLAVPVCALSGSTSVQLDGSGSADPDLDPLSYAWTGPFPEGGGTVHGVAPVVTLALGGPHVVVLTVSDGHGGSDSDDVSITLEDTSSPTLTVLNPAVSVTPGTGTMTYVDVIAAAGVTAIDACDPNPVLTVSGPSLFRRGTSTEVTVTATDNTGNAVSETVTVTVAQGGRPADPGKPDHTGPPPGTPKGGKGQN